MGLLRSKIKDFYGNVKMGIGRKKANILAEAIADMIRDNELQICLDKQYLTITKEGITSVIDEGDLVWELEHFLAGM